MTQHEPVVPVPVIVPNSAPPAAAPVGPPSRPPRRSFITTTTGIVTLAVSGAAVLIAAIAVLLAVRVNATRGTAVETPTVRLISCTIADRVATIGYDLTNNSRRTDSYLITVEVTDLADRRVGAGQDRVVDVAAGATVRAETAIVLDAAGGRTCAITDVS